MFSEIPEIYQDRKVKYVDAETIRPCSCPKIEKLEELKNDILARGMLYPLLLKDKFSMICLTGNQRLAILKFLGIKEVPVIFLNESMKLYLTPIIKISKYAVSGNNQEQKNFLKDARIISGKERVLKKRMKKKVRRSFR